MHVQSWRNERDRHVPAKTAHDAMIWLRDTMTDLVRDTHSQLYMLSDPSYCSCGLLSAIGVSADSGH